MEKDVGLYWDYKIKPSGLQCDYKKKPSDYTGIICRIIYGITDYWDYIWDYIRDYIRDYGILGLFWDYGLLIFGLH